MPKKYFCDCAIEGNMSKSLRFAWPCCRTVGLLAVYQSWNHYKLIWKMVWHFHPELWRRFNCTRRLSVDMKLLLVSSFSNNFVNNFITLRSINPFSTSPLIELDKVAALASLSHAFSTLCYHISSLKFPALFVLQLFSSKWFNCSFCCTI